MTDSEKLEMIISEMQGMRQDMQGMNQDIQRLDKRVTGISVHLENVTDKNIQLLAENFVDLTDKLNRAIPVADKNLAYEVKVNYLLERVALLEEKMQKN